MSNNKRLEKGKRNTRRFLREIKRNPELLELEQPYEITEESNEKVIKLWEDELDKAA